jgi:hypothetical protein
MNNEHAQREAAGAAEGDNMHTIDGHSSGSGGSSGATPADAAAATAAASPTRYNDTNMPTVTAAAGDSVSAYASHQNASLLSPMNSQQAVGMAASAAASAPGSPDGLTVEALASIPLHGFWPLASPHDDDVNGGWLPGSDPNQPLHFPATSGDPGALPTGPLRNGVHITTQQPGSLLTPALTSKQVAQQGQ